MSTFHALWVCFSCPLGFVNRRLMLSLILNFHSFSIWDYTISKPDYATSQASLTLWYGCMIKAESKSTDLGMSYRVCVQEQMKGYHDQTEQCLLWSWRMENMPGGKCPRIALLYPNTWNIIRRAPKQEKGILIGQWKRDESPTEARKRFWSCY